MNADGSDQHQITHLGGANFAPFFTPDGKRIIFSSNYTNPHSGNFDLYLINDDGSALEQVTNATGVRRLSDVQPRRQAARVGIEPQRDGRAPARSVHGRLETVRTSSDC